MVRTITLTNINMQSNLKWLLNFVFFSEIITFIQTPEEHWLLRVPDLSAIYSHCDAVLGVILDQPRSHQCQGGSRSVIALCKHCTLNIVLCGSWALLSLSPRPWLRLPRSVWRGLAPALKWSSCGCYYVCLFCLARPMPGPPGVRLWTMNGPCLQWPRLAWLRVTKLEKWSNKHSLSSRPHIFSQVML